MYRELIVETKATSEQMRDQKCQKQMEFFKQQKQKKS